MVKILDFFEKGRKNEDSLLRQESTVESHLDVMLMWLLHKDTKAIVDTIDGAKQLYDRMLSDRNTVAARMRTLRIAIRAYEEGYESISTSKDGKVSTFVPMPHPNSRAIMQNQIHLIDAIEKNLIGSINMLLALIEESARKTKKEKYLTHASVMREAVTQFALSFDKIEAAIDKLPVPPQQTRAS